MFELSAPHLGRGDALHSNPEDGRAMHRDGRRQSKSESLSVFFDVVIQTPTLKRNKR
jgi:hypothetical protein